MRPALLGGQRECLSKLVPAAKFTIRVVTHNDFRQTQMLTIRTAVAAAAIAILVAPAPASAQIMAPPTHVSVNTGLFQFSLTGNGYAPMVAVRATTPIASVLMVEGSVLAARPGQQFATTTFLVPEAQIQLVLPFEAFIPYMGLGAGAAVDLRDGSSGGLETDLTISGSLGVKSWLQSNLGVQGEVRLRGVDASFTGSSSEYTLGLIWRI